MTCADVLPDLPAYHLGLLAADARPAFEAHLVGCPACIRAFVDLKRSLELGEAGPRPSAALHGRLRASLAAELAAPVRTWRWWERPLALTVAAAATLIAFATVAQLHVRPAAPPHSLASTASP
jgi:anti-sigma factor RsiW